MEWQALEVDGLDEGETREVRADRPQSYRVRLLNRAALAPTLARALRGRRALLVTTPTVERLYGEALRLALLERGQKVELMVLPCSEADKSLDLVQRLCARAQGYGLERTGVLVALGGGVLSDVVTVAASLIRRGIEHIRAPTTLIGQIDAGIGVKGAVNFGGRKSYLGCFYAPSEVLIAPELLRTLPASALSEGLSEILKMALVRDAGLFEDLEAHGPALLAGRFGEPGGAGERVLWRAIELMLEELEPNLFEDRSWERLVDFGHTFSPLLEAELGFTLGHGFAVGVDMALCAAISLKRGLLQEDELGRILRLMDALALPVWHSALSAPVFARAVQEAAVHRGGRPNVILPRGIGRAICVQDPGVFDEESFEFARLRLACGP